MRIAAFLLVVCSALASIGQEQSQTCPFSPLPAPTGKFAVATLVLPIQKLHGTGSTRRVQLWYPADAASKAEPVSYVPDSLAVGVFQQEKFLEQPACVFENWTKLKIAAKSRAEPLHINQKFPLVIISPGAGMPRHLYTIYAQQLASDGFVAATVDYAKCGFLTDGKAVVEECPNEDTEAAFALVAEDWAAHISELLDNWLGKSRAGEPLERKIALLIDSHRIAAIGHSLGGEASLMACEKDSRIRACIDMDGGVGGSRLIETGISRTALILHSHPLYSDADLAKRHRTREEFGKMGEKAKAEIQALIAKPGGDVWALSIDGTGHLSYSDAPYTMPNTISRFGGTIIDPGRLMTIVTHTLESYMQHEFDRRSVFQIDLFPEVKLQASRAAVQ